MILSILKTLYIGDTKRGIFASFSFGKQNRTGRKLLSQITGSSKFRIENKRSKEPGFSDRLREMETNGTIYNLLTMNCETVSNYLRSNSQFSLQVTSSSLVQIFYPRYAILQSLLAYFETLFEHVRYKRSDKIY